MLNYKEIIDNYQIKHVQIQTVDLCNSRCVMCPYPEISHSKTSMKDDMFEKIILELKKGIEDKKIVPDVQIRIFLHNEPLLDPQLLERVAFIKKIIPTCIVRLSTNGFLFPQWKEKLIDSKIDMLTWSYYGDTEENFFRTTRIKKTQEELHEIQRAFNFIKESPKRKFKIYKLGEVTDRVMQSRASYFEETSRSIYEEVFACGDPLKRNLSFLNFFQEGSVTLCCQDFLKETTMGNISNQTLEEIMSSDKWHEIKSKTLGAPSEDNFICKRCELAEGCLVSGLKSKPTTKFF